MLDRLDLPRFAAKPPPRGPRAAFGLAALATAALCSGATGCQETPSYELRWTVAEPAIDLSDTTGNGAQDASPAPPLTTSNMCSRHGIAEVVVDLYRDIDLQVSNIDPETSGPCSNWERVSQESAATEVLDNESCAAPSDETLKNTDNSDLCDIEGFGSTGCCVKIRADKVALEECIDDWISFNCADAAPKNPDPNECYRDTTKASVKRSRGFNACTSDEDLIALRENRSEQLVVDAAERASANPQYSRLNRRVFPCFPRRFDDESHLAKGGDLGYSGTVTACVYGVSRSGRPFLWPEELEPTYTIASHTIQGVRLREGETVRLVPETGGSDETFELIAPLQCLDGIDNDRDGLVDDGDPSCRLDARLAEDGDQDVAFVDVALEIYEGGDDFLCGPAEVGAWRMFVLDEQDEVIASRTVAGCASGEVEFEPFVEDLTPDDTGTFTYTILVEGLDFVPDTSEDAPPPVPEAAPRVGPLTDTFQVSAGNAGLIDRVFSVGPDDWMPALEQVAGISYLALEPGSSDPEDRLTQGCITDSPESGLLTMNRVSLELQDENGDPVDPGTWQTSEGPLTVVGNVGQGTCLPNQLIEGPSYTWGRLFARVTMGVDDEACFTTDGFVPLYPRTLASQQQVQLERVLGTDQMPSATCRDCVDDDDCSETADCEMGICRPALQVGN